MSIENNNLDTYRILFLVYAILNFVALILPMFYIFMGATVGSVFSQVDDKIPFNPGLIFVFIGGFIFLIILAFGILNLKVSQFLKERSHFQFIFVMSIVNCLTGVLGIALGVLTIIELNKPEVKALFKKK